MLRARAARAAAHCCLGAHMGSFEVMHSLGRRQPGLRVAMAMYEENARKIGGILAAINPDLDADIIALGQIDAMLNIAERLDQGAFVGVLADRTLGEEPVQAVTFLGQGAYVPTGPMRAAAILRCPVFFMAGLYRGKNNYHVVFEQVADFSRHARRQPRSCGARRASSVMPRCSTITAAAIRTTGSIFLISGAPPGTRGE